VEHIKDILKSLPQRGTERALSDELERGQYACAICRDAHFVHPLREDGSVDYSMVVPCRCVREQLQRERMERLLQYCELPSGTGHMTFESFRRDPHLQEAYDLALQVAEGNNSIACLTLSAGVDRGKTHLAISICRRWLERGQAARYAYVPLLLEELRRGFREEGDSSYEARFDRFLNIPLLVMDDLGAESRTPWVQEKLDTIVDYRIMQGLPLVVTTNMPANELPFRIESRLKRSHGARVVTIDSPEFRKAKNEPV